MVDAAAWGAVVLKGVRVQVPSSGKITPGVPELGGIAQPDRASALQAEGPGFESQYLHKIENLKAAFL